MILKTKSPVSPTPPQKPNSQETGIRVWNVADGHELRRLSATFERQSQMAFSPDGSTLLVSTDSGEISAIDFETGQEQRTFGGHSGRVNSIVYSPDGRRVLTSGEDAIALLWDPKSGRPLLNFDMPSGLSKAGFLLSDQRIVIQSRDGSQIWDTNRQEPGMTWTSEGPLQTPPTGAIQNWLVLAPLPRSLPDHVSAVDHEPIPQEAQLQPRAGQKHQMGELEWTWAAVRTDRHKIDFNALIDAPASHAIAYAVTYIHTESRRSGLALKVGSDDEAKLYLNGQEVYRGPGVSSWVGDHAWVGDIELQSGLNVLVFKVINQGGDWAGSVSITDAEGNAFPGLTITADPRDLGR